mmetsp:Transcript_4493/g.9252  ORF Transcript_4493/g.9252 Transcript_4493/m.9252 type:complete len:283 (+) Transcript_4493:181-1029(+)
MGGEGEEYGMQTRDVCDFAIDPSFESDIQLVFEEGEQGGRRRRRLVEVMRRVGIRLKLPSTITALALTYAYRFGYKCKSTSTTMLVMSCLFLAAKASDYFRRPRDIINVFMRVLRPDLPLATLKEIERIQGEVFVAEQLVLRALGFKFELDLPHRYVLYSAWCLRENKEFLELCLMLLNDIYMTTAPACYCEKTIAAAVLSLALTSVGEADTTTACNICTSFELDLTSFAEAMERITAEMQVQAKLELEGSDFRREDVHNGMQKQQGGGGEGEEVEIGPSLH